MGLQRAERRACPGFFARSTPAFEESGDDVSYGVHEANVTWKVVRGVSVQAVEGSEHAGGIGPGSFEVVFRWMEAGSCCQRRKCAAGVDILRRASAVVEWKLVLRCESARLYSEVFP